MAKIIVVGAGLFGSIAADLADSRDCRDVTLIDHWTIGAASSASQASGCLMRDSWFNALTKEEVNEGYKILDSLYGLEELQFNNIGLLSGVKVNIKFVNPDIILSNTCVCATVVKVDDGVLTLSDGRKLRGNILVAAGPATSSLIDMPPMRGLTGLSMRFHGQLKEPLMKVWAPYRQALAFNINKKEIWFGDGTAIKSENWNYAERLSMAIERAEKHFGLVYNPRTTRVNVGTRPYVEGFKAGYFKRVSPKVWVSTGGAKNGTLLAAIQAARFLRELKT